MKLSTPTGKLNFDAYAGKESVVTLTVTNTASADLKDVSFSSWSFQMVDNIQT